MDAECANENDTLRAQSALHDWSATLVTDDWALLSAPAIARARMLYARRYAPKPDIVAQMQAQIAQLEPQAPNAPSATCC